MCECRVRGDLGEEVDAAVYDTEGGEVENNIEGFALLSGGGVVADAVVLGGEEGGEGGAVAAAVGFGEDVNGVVVGFVGLGGLVR